MAAPILFIVGPTASGKTALALLLAEELGGEIICADSRTIYKGLDIGTAKPTVEEQARVPHWGLDLVEPNQRYSAADFKDYAVNAIKDIQERGKLPMIVGGTGLYVDGVLFDFNFGDAADPKLRAELEAKSVDELQTIILERDIEIPENENNKRYLIRAIEQGGVNRQKKEPKPGSFVVGLLPEREVLDDRIKSRIDSMISAGAIEEAKWLREHFGEDAPAAAAPFYKAFMPFLKNESDMESSKAQFYLNDRNLSKRQITWFKRNPHINWFESPQAAYDFVYTDLAS